MTTITTQTSSAVPNPGSPDAVARGCTCPTLDNGHGRAGVATGVWWINQGCSVHAPGDPRRTEHRGS